MNTPLWFSNLLFWSAQVAVLALAAAFLPRLLQLRQPRVLLAYWRALLAVAFLLPVVQPWHRVPAFGSFVIAPDVTNVAATPIPVASHWNFPSWELIAQILGVAILAGIAVRFAILALGLLKLRQFRQSSSSISSFAETAAVLEKMRAILKARAEFRLSTDVLSPVTFGFTAPVILLPARFTAMDARFQSAIACHELLHVRRRDWAHHLLEEVIRAIFWFHPAIAWLIARVRLAREQVVDLEVVQLTNARKPYLEALLEFTNSRAPISAVPAPPFLVERQLAERVALMLKEVSMSRTRLIASLTAISCCVTLVIVLAVWTFPLKAAPRLPQNPPQGGVAQAVPGGVSGGVTGGVSGGVNGGVPDRSAATPPAQGVNGGIADGISEGSATAVRGISSSDIPTVENSAIWTDTVKRGPMVRQVRGLGTLVRAKDSTIAKVLLPETMTREVHANQNAVISTQNGPVATGHVISVSRGVVNGTVAVDISLEAVHASGDKIAKLDPHFVGVPDQVDATIDVEKLDNILYVGRPAQGAQNSTIPLFKIVKDGTEAVRVEVKLGRVSVNTIEILDGLKEGDKIILSDMSPYGNADRVHITDEKHLAKP
jgi:beta-lactamase regulating signal transducer with metallopeptidase domain